MEVFFRLELSLQPISTWGSADLIFFKRRFREVNGRVEMEFLSSRYRYAVDQGTGAISSLRRNWSAGVRSSAAISPAGMLHRRLHMAKTWCRDRAALRNEKPPSSRLGFDPGHLLSSEHTSSLYDTCLLALLLAPDRPFLWNPLPYRHPYRRCYSTSHVVIRSSNRYVAFDALDTRKY